MEQFSYKKFTHLNDDIIRLRTVVFVAEQGFKEEFDETDKRAVHLVLYDGTKAIATCRYFKDGPNYHIGRVAVLKQYRGKSLGYQIMRHAEAEIKKDGGTCIELSAQIRVKDFYQKLGYQASGDIYLDQHCPHINMVKNL
ncbi:MAG: GNAT family N-acetyltransferase [Elusimicrobiaceae bacterium]|nr:GNAT family N-acetyltransferase [Elusimicrobiaceae bacterium]